MNNSKLLKDRQAILAEDFSEQFVEKMKNAIETSHYKYSFARKHIPS